MGKIFLPKTDHEMKLFEKPLSCVWSSLKNNINETRVEYNTN